MTTTHVIKINLPGGFISAGDLYEMLVIAENAGAQNVRFGNRQQMYFTIDARQLEDMEMDMLRGGIVYEVDANEHQNMISSYVGDGIFSMESWMREGVYKDIFDLFNYQPKLKVDIIDRHQTFVHFFSGNFNFISADISNYWYLYVRFPKTSQFYCWPSLIYTDDIPLISKKAEEIILKNRSLFYDKPNIDEAMFFEKVTEGIDLPFQDIGTKLELPDFQLPYYEGFNKYANNKYWLGVYRRNEHFDIAFLKDVCNLCLKTRIGQLYTTPWKSILIKGIEQSNRNDWGRILDKYRLNIRHASNELNWQTEDLCQEGITLKQQLVREFEDADLRTYRLSFAIKTQPKTGLPGSVIIKVHPSGAYEILHTADFNPNSKTYVSYKSRIKRSDLAKQLINLCNRYYNHLAPQNSILDTAITESEEVETVTHPLYECRFCKTLYDSTYGDTANSIPAGTPFSEVSAAYTCPVCEADKNYFELTYKSR